VSDYDAAGYRTMTAPETQSRLEAQSQRMSVIQECEIKIAQYEADLKKATKPMREVLLQRIRERREILERAKKEAGLS